MKSFRALRTFLTLRGNQRTSRMFLRCTRGYDWWDGVCWVLVRVPYESMNGQGLSNSERFRRELIHVTVAETALGGAAITALGSAIAGLIIQRTGVRFGPEAAGVVEV